MGPSSAAEGASATRIFETYVEKALVVPTLRARQVVVMDDNLGAQKPKRVRGLIEERCCELLYLPPYSPDLNPIEEAFAKVKGLLRKAEARTCKASIEAMGQALKAVTAQDTRSFFEHCGYRACDR